MEMEMAESSGGSIRIPVVYYLSRNRHLEHPHFIEVSLSSPNAPHSPHAPHADAFFLRDFIHRLNQVRGKGMAAMYSWSCKRSYKNGFVWHDLSEDDLILPANGNEYVLKGSELLDPSPPDRPNHSNKNPKPTNQTRPRQDSTNLPRRKSKEASPSSSVSPPPIPNKHSKPLSPLSLSSSRDEEQPPSSLSSGSHSPDQPETKFHRSVSSADAWTQTEETATESHAFSMDDKGLLDTEATNNNRNSCCRKSEMLESLIRAEGRKFNQLNLNPHHHQQQQQNELDRTSSSTTGEDTVVNLDHGDPTMFEPFWKESGQKATVVISGWHTMSYFSDTGQLCWFLEPSFAKEVRRLHTIIGNAVTDTRHIIVGVGSTQLIHAVFYALSSGEPNHPVPVVSAAPYYSMYPGIADLLKSGLFHWGGDASTFEGGGNSSFIEIVCSPNNPDGAIRRAVLDSEAGKWVHDLAYYWPQYTPMRSPADEDIMLFTVSKATGHAGTRIGWALVKDADVARRMVKFIEMNSIGVSKDSQVRAARILQVVSDGYELPDSKGAGRLFHFSRRLLADRWRRLRQAVEESGRFSLPHFPSEFCEFTKEHAETYPAFAWLRCDDESIKDCEDFFKSIKVLTRSGKHFGAGPEYVRISMLDRAHNFDLFVERISYRGLG